MSCNAAEGDALLVSNQVVRSFVDEVLVKGEKVIRIHTAWQLKNGSILLYEYSSRNNPSSSFTIHDNLDHYEELFKQIRG
ncbi:hypothetical protein [Paenibacillus montanisoli]|uniref:Uncharacterized protein n=1 Tax=Paenibacillus montanisoli TaxID=2081970 RepID=A0A328U0L3_9BACL|nr:hypothetical protein [Paenibacillus montanisoli]RAP76328.1 hypothetical protein DL346_13090 [Paenibacillus montanisoli]